MQEIQETQFPFLNKEYSLQEEMATHSSIPAWKIPWTEEPGGLQSVESDTTEELETTEAAHTCTHTMMFPIQTF